MKHIIVAVVVAMPALVQGGQPDVLSKLTLDEAVRRGLQASPRLAESAARGEAAAAVADQRHAGMLPQVAAQAGYARTNHVEEFGVPLPNNQLRIIYPDVPDNYRARLDVQWPVYTGGRLEAIERAARSEAVASSSELEAARTDLRLEITRAYWTLVTADESVRVVDESLARTRAHLQDARNRLDAGLTPPNEVLTAEAQESRQRMFSIQARANRDVAEAELGRLIGVAPGTSIQPDAVLDPPAPEPSTFESLVAAARQNRRDRAALVERVGAAREREAAAVAGAKPTVGVGGGYDYARPNPRIFPREEAWRGSWDASVNVNWPLFDGGRARAETAEAAAGGRALQARLAEFDALLDVEVRRQLNDLEASRAVIAAAADGVRAAAEARRVATERFAAGVATSTDVLDAQVALLQAELDRTQAIANARLAEARLTRAIGR